MSGENLLFINVPVTTQHPKPARGPGVHEETVHFGYQAVRRYAILVRLEAFGSFVSCEHPKPVRGRFIRQRLLVAEWRAHRSP